VGVLFVAIFVYPVVGSTVAAAAVVGGLAFSRKRQRPPQSSAEFWRWKD
jgi:hypothetical protein